MPSVITEVYTICDAYESGIGHGQKMDKHDNAAGDLYSDPKCNESYQIGYAFGKRKAEQKSKNSNSATWEDFDIVYEKATKTGNPNDWMQAAMYAKQIKNEVINRLKLDNIELLRKLSNDNSAELALLLECKNVLLDANRNGFTRGFGTLGKINEMI